MKKQPFFKMASIDAHHNHRQLLPSSLGPRLLLLTFMITLTCLRTAPTYAAPSSGSDPGLDMDASFFGATDIVRPSIYSYTITNPTKQLLREQDQQQRQQLEQQQKLKQQQQLASNDIAYSNNNNNKHRNHSNKNNNNNNVNNKNLMNTQNYRSGNTNRNLYYINNSNNNNNNNNNVRSNKNKIRSHTHSNNNMSEIHNNNNDNNSKISNNNNNNLKNTYYSSYSPSYAPTLSTPSSYPSGSEFSGVSSPTASISSGFSPSSSFSLSSLSSSVPSNLPAPSASLPVPVSGCNMDRLAVYKVVLHTYWTRDLFPKHFPDWRPTAQWTKTIGRTHDAAYALYHIGQQATSGVKQFAETGKSDIIDSMAAQQQQQQQTQQKLGNSFTSFVPSSGSQAKSTQTPQQQQRQQQQQQQQQPLLQNGGERSSVFDEFAIPAITTGAGRSETKFFVDSNHSLVSLMTRIVPSPDWFIGVDSFQLCVGGSWIDTVTIEMDPLDAGTDNGFTFTAPNWPTSPQGVIYRITSRYPAHPAGSFFYPKSKRLPPIATYQLIKLKEYDLSEVFNFAEDDRKYETVRTQTHLETEHNHVEMNNELSASIERERQNEATPVPTSVTERDRIRSELLAKMNPMNNASNVVPKNDKHALMQNIAQSYHRRGGDGRSSSVQSKRRRTRRQRDCRVSHWSEWSACSKNCGIGEMNRYRKVIKHGRRGGRPCPALQESKWCGSEKGCHNPENYFNWSIT